MKNSIKFLCLILAALICIPMFAACAADTSYVMTSGTKKYAVGPYAFYAYFMKDSYDMQYYTHYNTRISAILNEKVSDDKYFYESLNETIQQQYLAYIIVSEKFDELGLKLTEEQKATVEQQYQTNYLEAYGATKFNDMLQKMNITETEFKELLTVNIKNDALTDYYFGANGQFEVTDTQKRTYFNENYSRLKYIVISKVDSDGKTLTTAELIEKDNLVKELKEKLDAGESFEDMIAQYSEFYTKDFTDMTEDEKTSAETYNTSLVEDGMIVNKNGIYNATLYSYYGYTLDSTLVDFLFGHEVGEYDVFELTDSYWIIKKCDLNEKNDYFNGKETEIFNALTSDQISLLYQTWRDAFVYEFNNAALLKYDVRNLDPMFINLDQ